MKRSQTKDRIRQALDIRGMKQSELAEKTGIDKGQLSSYISGKYKPKQNNLDLIARALSVDEAWLMGYDVPMERRETRKVSDDSPQIISFFNKLNSNGKEIATEQVRLLTLDEKYTMPDKIIPLKKDTTEPVGNAAHVRTDLPESELTPDLQREDEEIWKNF